MLPFHALPSQSAHDHEDTHTYEVHIYGHTHSFSNSSHPPLPQQQKIKKQLDFNQILQNSYQQQRFNYNQRILKSYIINMQAAVWFGDQLSPGGGRRRSQKGMDNGQLASTRGV